LAKSLRALIASLKFADLSPRSISHILAWNFMITPECFPLITAQYVFLYFFYIILFFSVRGMLTPRVSIKRTHRNYKLEQWQWKIKK
jgi:hypothetical protein